MTWASTVSGWRCGAVSKTRWTTLHFGSTARLVARVLRDHWYEIINDNSDPDSINPSGYQFAELDHTVENVILPLKQRLEANNESLFVNLNVVDFTCCQGASNLEYQDSPDEYAELVLATYQHLQSQYGWVPDAWEVILEPDKYPLEWHQDWQCHRRLGQQAPDRRLHAALHRSLDHRYGQCHHLL